MTDKARLTSNAWTISRTLCGIAIALSSCLYLAQVQGMLPAFANLDRIAIFPAMGILWGLLLTWISRPTQNLTFASRTTHQSQNFMRANFFSCMKQSQGGVLDFSIIGAVAHATAMFQELKKPDAIQVHLYQLFGTLFLGLIVWAILTSIASPWNTMLPPEIKQQHQQNATDADLWWYLAGSICVMGCISLVFRTLT